MKHLSEDRALRPAENREQRRERPRAVHSVPKRCVGPADQRAERAETPDGKPAA